jgi:hypothetical protein
VGSAGTSVATSTKSRVAIQSDHLRCGISPLDEIWSTIRRRVVYNNQVSIGGDDASALEKSYNVLRGLIGDDYNR